MKTFKEQRQSSLIRLLLGLLKKDRLVRRMREAEDNYESDNLNPMKLLMMKKAPNLTINVPNALTDPRHLWTYVGMGALLQSLVSFFNAYVVYPKNGCALAHESHGMAFLFGLPGHYL